ncbi:MAG: triose-phosphate isomerase [Elusimicrobiota bacterium]
MRKPMVVANWKMNKSQAEVGEFAAELTRKIPHGTLGKVEVVICPTFIHLPLLLGKGVLPSGVYTGAQDCHWEDSGAFTGCVSARMLKDMKVRHAIIGHSERRRYFAETDVMLGDKLKSAMAAGLVPIFCVGESLQEREAQRTFTVLDAQLAALGSVSPDIWKGHADFVLAYEPVWAIGTGKNATAAQAQEAHAHLRGRLAQRLGVERAQSTRILYGGSVTPENFRELLDCPDVDGGLVGGASLKAESYLKLVVLAGD